MTYFTNHGANDTDIKGKLMVTKKKKNMEEMPSL